MNSGDDLRLTLRSTGGRYSLVVDNLTRHSSSTLADRPPRLPRRRDRPVRRALRREHAERPGQDPDGSGSSASRSGRPSRPRRQWSASASRIPRPRGTASDDRQGVGSLEDRPRIDPPSSVTSRTDRGSVVGSIEPRLRYDPLTENLSHGRHRTLSTYVCLGLGLASPRPPSARPRRRRPPAAAAVERALPRRPGSSRTRPTGPPRSLRSSPAGASGSPIPSEMDDLNPETLAKHDALLIYANINEITPAQEKALIDYVEGGGAFVPVHCASYCFLNSPRYIALVGAQFLRHGTGDFDTKVVDPSHPIMKGLEPFRTWDETYVHHKHNEEGRHVLQVRQEGQTRGAVDLGPDPGQRARLLHGLRPRRPDLAEPRFPRPARAGHPLGGEQGAGPRQPGPRAGRAAAVHLRRGVGRHPQLSAGPPVGHAGRADPPDAAPALARGVDAAHGRAARLRAQALRRRARDRQAASA